jgi:hypothetical protein
MAELGLAPQNFGNYPIGEARVVEEGGQDLNPEGPPILTKHSKPPNPIHQNRKGFNLSHLKRKRLSQLKNLTTS